MSSHLPSFTSLCAKRSLSDLFTKRLRERCALEINNSFRTSMDTDLLTQKVIGCAIEVHKQLGPGLLESTYETCLLLELKQAGIDAKYQVELPILYKNTNIYAGYRLDILITNELIVELKSVEKLLPIHSAQLLTYMKLSNVSTGLLINFNTTKLINGIKRLNLKF